MSADFPETKEEFLFLFSQLKRFLLHRVLRYEDNSNLIAKIMSLLNEDSFRGNREYIQLLSLVANYFEFKKEETELSTILNRERKEFPAFVETYLEFVKELLHSGIALSSVEDGRFIRLLDFGIKDDLSEYYSVLKQIDEKRKNFQNSRV